VAAAFVAKMGCGAKRVVCRPWAPPPQPVPGSRALINGGSAIHNISAAGAAATTAGSAAARNISVLAAAAAQSAAVEAVRAVKAVPRTRLDIFQVRGTAGGQGEEGERLGRCNGFAAGGRGGGGLHVGEALRRRP